MSLVTTGTPYALSKDKVLTVLFLNEIKGFRLLFVSAFQQTVCIESSLPVNEKPNSIGCYRVHLSLFALDPASQTSRVPVPHCGCSRAVWISCFESPLIFWFGSVLCFVSEDWKAVTQNGPEL